MSKNVLTTLQLLSIWAIASVLFGFLIVNIYLAIFGFWDYNFLKIQYVSAGTLFLVMVALPSGLFLMAFRAKSILEQHKKKFPKSKIGGWTINVNKWFILSFIFLLGVYISSFPMQLSSLSPSKGYTTAISVLWVLAVWYMVFLVVHYYTEVVKNNYGLDVLNLRTIVKYFLEHTRLLYFIFAIPGLVLGFAFLVYPIVPRYLGGGEMVPIEIGFSQNYNYKEIGLMDPAPVMLIYQSPDSLLALTTTGTYLIQMKDVDYIKYLGGNRILLKLQQASFQNTKNSSIK